MDDKLIIITGCARSGAGVVAGIINACGAFGGHMSNKKGLYENDILRESVIKPYLLHMKVDSLGQYPLLDDNKNGWVPEEFGEWVKQRIIDEGYKKGKWMVKDTKACQMWKVWDNAFPKAKWIIVRRRTPDIIQSCLKTSYMCAFKDEKNRQRLGVLTEEAGWLWWIHEHEKRFIEMVSKGINYREIWPERIVNGDYKQLYDILEWAGLKWNPEALSLIDPLILSNLKKERA